MFFVTSTKLSSVSFHHLVNKFTSDPVIQAVQYMVMMNDHRLPIPTDPSTARARFFFSLKTP